MIGSRWNMIAGRILLPSLLLLALTACSAVPKPGLEEIPAKRPASRYLKIGVTDPIEIYDPWEKFNRGVYRFNFYFDKYFFLPVVGVYETITPDFVENGISSFFLNIGEIKNVTHSALQLKGGAALKSTGRLVINSTLGVAGIFDPATDLGICRQDEDFGQTLGHYGIGNGPYLVLPIFGPSNLRDAGGLLSDAILQSAVDPLNFSHNENLQIPYYALSGVDARHREKFRYYETGSPFEYDLIRLLYSKQRQIKIDK